MTQVGLLGANQGLDQYVVLYLPMVGANAGTTFADLSASAHGITVNSTTTSTGTSKFDGSSASFDGATTSLVAASSAEYNLPGDFTIDFLMRTTVTGQVNKRIISTSNASVGLDILLNSSNFIRVLSDDGLLDVTGAIAAANSNWNHISVTRSGTAVKLFTNGVLDNSGTSSATLNPSTTLTVGKSNGGANFYSGNLQMLRVSKGIARWTASFTPPGVPFS